MSRRTNKEIRAIKDMENMQTPQAQVKVNIEELEDITCSSCGNYTFIPVMFMKKVSVLLTQSGKEEILPIQIYACNVCNMVLPSSIPWMKPTEEKEDEEPKSTIIT